MRYPLLVAAVALACIGCSSPSAPVGAAELKTEEDKTLYALGSAIGRNLSSFDLTEAELEFVKAGIADAALHKEPKLDASTYFPRIQELQNARVAAAGEKEKKAGEEYLAKAATESGAQKTASGLVYKQVSEGTGASPKATDTVKVHYHGTLTNGKVFDSSVERKEPATFPLNGVIPCWTEGVQLMKVGGKARFVCPPDIAYGDRGAPPDIKPGSTLVFEVELLGIEQPQQ
ncbi:FKBP-type peptidyl-prolyl cis-trans isomerase [Povalibacter uvarum]|uniref:Peptidyl-prolyl cis-trans isomerase n=1 Tax=Povalibacter uvarum TaxID=732238 RepID=A0A841HPL4_9GAMM|nr:FKBP-type peptidyl-prolyl cis-trans isomerase [Povalibacter uvarum]MBB6094713.1 FKBP-type peptidyl-prolyl cis-trans isomerase [Povalibacter uvarum]